MPMDIKRRQLPVSTGQSLEKISRLLGINLSSFKGKLYSVILLMSFCFLNQMSWRYLCVNYCEKQYVKKFMITFQHILYILLVLTIVGTSLFHPKQFSFPRHEMSVIDTILESYGAHFSNKDIFLMKHLQDIVTATMILLSTLKYVNDTITNNLFWEIWVSVCTWYSIVLLLIIDGLFAHYLNDIYLRFRELNKITIQYSLERLSISYVDFTANLDISNTCNNTVIIKIRSIQYIHHGLYVLAMKVNKNFGLQLLIASGICLNATILFLHDIYHNIKENTGNIKMIIFHISFISSCALRSLYISYICQQTKNKSRQMAKILHDVFLEHRSLRPEIIHFSLQLVHEDLMFTAFNLYEINIPIMCSIAGAVVTYLVMVIQLDIAAKFGIANTTWNHIENNITNINNI